MQCGDTDYAALDLVLQAFGNMHNHYQKMYDSVNLALDKVTGEISDVRA